ncbi:hypothetical protein ERJ75_001205300 [Trypanosoma vivax]|nr:hypothetical protein ERJ75_001205300 [Trypanosoma vivax]
MRKKEEILLCNASRTYIDWNVTFRALRKRALNVNATATTILKNFTLYRNSDNVRKKAEDALEKVKGAVSNTTAALVVADSFMNGIELDFFNAFEAIKGSPQNYIFGHSNMHDEKSKRRISEVQTFFDDIKIFFSRCNATNNGKAETLESMEKAVMDVVDQAVNLSSWKKRRVKEWNKTLNQVESWLHDMKNYTGQSSKTNIWNYSVTIWNITRTDCGTIEKGNTGADSSVKLVEAAYDNVIRHLRDIANESFISSVEENGCNETYSHFRTILAESLYNKTYDKNEIKEMCKKIKNKKEESCASAKTSFQWIKERFKVAVPKMIENLNYSLTELINAEKVAQEAAKSIAAEAVGHVCNAKGQADVFSAKHNAVENFNVNVETNISLLIASLDGVEEKLTNALNKTNSALNILSASASDVKALEVAHNDSGVQKESQLTVEDARAAKRQAEELAKTLKTASSELKHHNNNLDASLREKNAHLKDIAKKVSVAINVTNERQENNGEFGLSCEGIDRVLQNVTTDKAIDIIKKLEKDNLVNTAVELNKTLQKSEGNVSSLDGRISQMNANFSLAKSNTESALNRLHDVVQKSQNFQRAALAAVVELLNKNKSALCALQEELTALSIQNETVSRRSEKLVEDISGIKDAASKLAADAAVSMHNCTSVAKLAKEAALLRPGATGADDKAQYAEQNCTLAVQEVSTTNEKALAFVGVATGAKNDAVKLQGQLTELIREKKKRLEKTKGTFAEMLKNASVKPLKVENTCEAVNFSEYVTTFEQAEKIFPQLRGVDSFGVDDVKRNITALEGLVSSAEANLSRAQSNVVLSKESSKNAEKYASECGCSRELYLRT